MTAEGSGVGGVGCGEGGRGGGRGGGGGGGCGRGGEIGNMNGDNWKSIDQSIGFSLR